MRCRGPIASSSWLQAASARAQGRRDLADVEIEDLMRIEVQRVFGASERLQPVTEAPSSVTIVTADEIARYGYRTLADILRSVRGFYVSNDRNYSYLGVRGFARPGDYNTRVLLLLNGHRVNDNSTIRRRSAPISASTWRCSIGWKSFAGRRRRSTAPARSSPSST